jgi:(2Fe-2S) ferredoxin
VSAARTAWQLHHRRLARGDNAKVTVAAWLDSSVADLRKNATHCLNFPVFVPSLSWYKDGVWYEMARQRCTQRTSPTVRARGGTVTSCERERRCCWRCSISSLELPLPCGYAHNRDERAASDESTHTFQAKNATIKSKQKWSPRSARTETVIA